MTIVKADILTEVNENLLGGFSAGDITTRIQAILDDLSEEDLLEDTDGTQTLVTDGTTLNEPTDFRALIDIVLTVTATGSEQFPLIALRGGIKEYDQLRHNDNSVGIPRWFANSNGKFFLWRPANQAFTSLIRYYKNHPQDVDNIEFGDNFKNAIYAGVTMKMAMKMSNTRMISQWAAIYVDAKQKRIDSIVHIPRFVRGN